MIEVDPDTKEMLKVLVRHIWMFRCDKVLSLVL